MQDLKLIALDAEDLAILSAHLQDAVLRVGDLAYLKSARRFAAVVNRFDWSAAQAAGGKRYIRRRAGLRFERVMAAKLLGIDLGRPDEVLSLLAVVFEPAGEPENPAGRILLQFSGDRAIRLDVECIEVELSDLGAAWSARSRPAHAGDEQGKAHKS